MKELIRYGFTLMVICAAAAGLLAGVNALTQEKILAQAQGQEDVSLKEVMPQGQTFEPVKPGNQILYYKAFNAENKLVGAVFKAQGKGYAGVIETMVGILPDGTITAIKVISQNETPGLGAGVTESSFTDRFKNRNAQGLAGVEAITGATISSSAVISSVKEKAKEIIALLKNGQ